MAYRFALKEAGATYTKLPAKPKGTGKRGRYTYDILLFPSLLKRIAVFVVGALTVLARSARKRVQPGLDIFGTV